MMAKIGELQGTTIGIYIKDSDFSTYVVPHVDGIEILPNFDGEVDVCVTGTTASFLSYVRAGRRGEAVGAGRIEISGDLSTVQSIQGILSELNFDWEEVLSDIFGDVAAHRLGRLFRAIHKKTTTFSEGFEYDLKQYLRSETHLLPIQRDKERLEKAIFTLTDDVDRLEVRVKRITQDMVDQP